MVVEFILVGLNQVKCSGRHGVQVIEQHTVTVSQLVTLSRRPSYCLRDDTGSNSRDAILILLEVVAVLPHLHRGIPRHLQRQWRECEYLEK